VLLSFLTGRTQSVLCDGERSDSEKVLSGVPHGTILAPLLFLLHINELPAVVDPHTRCRLFADDCLLYRVIDSIEDQLQLQKDLAALEAWAADWGMQFNASKCHVIIVMTISRQVPQHRLHYMYQLCGVVLDTVLQEKYLCILLSHDMSWSNHIHTIAMKAHQKLSFLCRNLKGSALDCKKLAYVALVRSALEYASIICHMGSIPSEGCGQS